ncbi:ABC transporter permease [Demequina maris]|uniref:ABC transporter permease n=1 Tax=Demequina maris TaxID=1638982 RepID=UPI000781F533|nr:ABC transporter permease [Demequina maris]
MSTAVTSRTRGATVGAILRSELIKIRSMRSTWVGLAALLGIATLITAFGGNQVDGAVTSPILAEWILTVFQLALFLIAAFFAVQTASEWSTGMARTTFAAVPSRGRWVAGRVTACALSGAVAALAVVGAVLGLGVLLHSGGAQPFGPETLGLLWQAPLVVGLLSGFSAALAVLVRNAWLTVGALATLQFVLGIVAATLFTWFLQVMPYLPFDLAGTVLHASQAGADLAGSPGAGLAIALLVAWTVGASVAAAIVSRRRDGA